jgi:BirA family biotin operon repressor/biotin-[acetyl-CoA-carboxylase] ligase
MTINATLILRRLDDSARKDIDGIDCVDEIASTNDWLMAQPAPEPGRFRFVIANAQTAGRGRHDRRWSSPKGAGLYLSMAHTFREPPRQLPALTLALGAEVADALCELGVADVALKWPNDIIVHDAKLGGILTEARLQPGRSSTVVVGIGINVDLPDEVRKQIESERTIKVADLKECLDTPPPLDELAAAVIRALIGGSKRFSGDGAGQWRDAWQRYDWLRGKEVYIEQLGGPVIGTADGIDEDGALLVRRGGEVVRVISGTVALQDAPELDE